MNPSKSAPSRARGLGWLKGSLRGRRDQSRPWREEVQRTILDPEKSVLWLVGNPSTFRLFFPASEEHRANTTIFASSPAIADALRTTSKGNVDIAFAEFETAPLEGAYDLCIACLATNQIPDAYEAWLEGLVARALKPDGLAILPWPTSESSSAPAEPSENSLRSFQEYQLTPERPTLEDVFACSPSFELAAKETIGPERTTWLQLRRRASAPTKAQAAFSRSPRPDRFPMIDFTTLVRRLRKDKINVLPAPQFAERFATFDPDAECAQGYGVLKFDIHRGIKRAEEMAAILSNYSLPGLFLMMHKHDVNASFYDHPQTWSILNAIQSMGHEVGLHIDPFDLVRRHGDLISGVTEAANEFRDKGLSIDTATLHGDTSAIIRTRGLRALDFFREGTHVSSWDGVAPAGDEELAQHFRRYSLQELQAKSGIRYLVETTLGNRGTMVQPFIPLYISDNTRILRTSGGRKQRVRSEQPFRISYVLARRLATQMKQRPFLALFHPQWYW